MRWAELRGEYIALGPYGDCMGDASCNTRIVTANIDCKTRWKRQQKART